MASPRLLRRFEQESQALGRLQHPGIAQIYEAGTADTGFGPQPYFAMEFIRGKTLADYVETHRLSTRQRLELIVKVAEAVHHAHQRGLIHRDLKPGNILVDETGQPKILDFGVARATDSDTQSSSQTDPGQLVGTLAYMSPEQVLADALEIDTRSDVYALGVILYELLAGRLPYTISKQLHETIHAIKEEDPARLSLVSRTYRGDIETIAAKALEKDKARRYGSAAELAADIQRYLHDEPIMAQPQSTAYQLQKFARRHKALVAGTAAVFVVLAAGVVTATSLAVRARRAEQAATAERDRARQAEADAVDLEREKADLQRDLVSLARMDAENERNKSALAKRERDRATWNSLAEKSIRLSASRDDDELAALLARQAFLIHARTPDQPRYLVEEALQQANRISLWSRNISGHEGAVHSVEISKDGLRLASAGADRVIRVWNLEEPGAPPALFTGHTGSVNVVAFSPDGTHFASGGSDGLRIWNLREPGAPQLLPDGYPQGSVNSLAYSPDGMRIAYVDDDGAWILDLRRSGSAPHLLAANDPNPFTAIAFSPRD
jgi:hypothetical protein